MGEAPNASTRPQKMADSVLSSDDDFRFTLHFNAEKEKKSFRSWLTSDSGHILGCQYDRLKLYW